MSTDHVDVLIVGAGLSGIGAAHHLQANCPGKSYAILEARDAIGGTWDLFRYPGIRSDSDMYTLGYSFRPWREAKSIADGTDILGYVRDTAREAGIDRHIRFDHRVVRAEWSASDARWTVEVARGAAGDTVTMTCGFLFTCTGYYRYDEGYTPEFPGLEDFGGQLVHPQHWPEDLDCTGKRIVVIGSGATAVTLVPALAEQAAHVTMLQRSPSYVLSLPGRDPIADLLRRLLPAKVAYALVRWKNVAVTTAFFQLSRRLPNVVKKLIRKGVEAQLPEHFDVEKHFTPRYNPWDQRVCLVPDGDLFTALSAGRASIATDRIASFTETGIRLESGEELPADVVVTATGLNLLALGGMDLAVDGEDVVLSEHLGYKGMMISDVPNMALSIGYTNASWTLKCDLTCEYVCRLLNHMDEHGHRQVTARRGDGALETRPFIDLKSGYIERSISQFPQQGLKAPWRLYQNYARDIIMLRYRSLEDDALEFSSPAPAAVAQEPLAA
jgi:cation diffusion facilitator CzcD-associated flavoprotein CzcO